MDPRRIIRELSDQKIQPAILLLPTRLSDLRLPRSYQANLGTTYQLRLVRIWVPSEVRQDANCQLVSLDNYQQLEEQYRTVLPTFYEDLLQLYLQLKGKRYGLFWSTPYPGIKIVVRRGEDGFVNTVDHKIYPSEVITRNMEVTS